MTTDTLNYHYDFSSAFVSAPSTSEKDALFLSKYSELAKPDEAPCFFFGDLLYPQMTARCLLTLSKVVQSSFNLSQAELEMLRDPIVTAGNDRLRFEGFSHCAGVYAHVEVSPDALAGEFIQNGTTNVDFNPPMLSALGRVGKKDLVAMSLGKNDVTLHQPDSKVVERKVPLPTKWIKGLTTVQMFMADAELRHELTPIQLRQLFMSIPKATVKTDYYLIKRGNKYQFSPMQAKDAICIGALNRLRLLEPLLASAKKLRIYAHPAMQSTSWQLDFGGIYFNLTLSREAWRGFSGEGAALEALLTDVPDDWLTAFDNFSYANQSYNATLTALKERIDITHVDNLSARLAAMGLLGYDLNENSYFYRRLPYKPSRILTLNPRLRGANKLIEEGKVHIVSDTSKRTEARVAGSAGAMHTVIIEKTENNQTNARCTCKWFASHQGERGACKHVLAVKKLANS